MTHQYCPVCGVHVNPDGNCQNCKIEIMTQVDLDRLHPERYEPYHKRIKEEIQRSLHGSQKRL